MRRQEELGQLPSIVVVGYPKSGNTWATRLVGELLDAPVRGFFGSDRSDEPAIEGLDRLSPYSVYKAHHPFERLQEITTGGDARLIHVVRHPLDVAVSGAHLFRTFPGQSLFAFRDRGRSSMLLRKAVGVAYWSIAKAYRPLASQGVKRMLETILRGDDTQSWCEVPWSEYERPYVEQNVFTVRYEDLLASPEVEARRILDFLGEARSEQRIREAVQAQSLHRRKQIDPSDRTVRVGATASWQRHLSLSEARQAAVSLEPAFSHWGYEMPATA